MSKQPSQNIEWLKENLTAYLKPMMVDLLAAKPADPRPFMINWLQTKGHSLKFEPGSGSGSGFRLSASSDSEGERNDENDEVLQKLMKKKGHTKKKNAISAEAYGEYNKLGDYEPKVVKKSQEQIAQIREVLKKSFLFNSLDPKPMEIVLAAMEIKSFAKDQYVIRQGDDGQELYIVSTGKLKCYKKFPDKPEPKFLCDYSTGGVFGELSLLYNVPRAASIIAVEPSVCFSLDRNTFNHIVKTAAIKRRERYDDFINRVEILQELDPYERGKICDVLETQRFKKGEYIIKQGEPGDKFFLIEEGTADAIKTENGVTKKVFDYKPNDYFGELALLEDGIRKASIVVTSDEMAVASIGKESFKRLLGPLEEILKRNKSKYDKYMHKK